MTEASPATVESASAPRGLLSSARARALATASLLVAAAVALVAHMRLFDFVTDDAFISFVYSRNLAEHGQLVFNLGERVEGYTNFLWTVLLAALMKVGWQPESASVVWGCAFAIGTMIVCAFLVRHLRSDGAWSPWDALPALILSAIPGYACWSSGGLETQMFTFFVTLGLTLHLVERDRERTSPASAIAFALAALTRPEGNLFFALVGADRLVVLARARRLPSLRELAWGAIYLALVVPHFLWRHHYYGWWLPNTFYIKSSGGSGTWGRGLYYLRRCVEQHSLWALIPVGAAGLLGANARTRRFLGLAALVVAVFFLYVASVGGDFMGLFRFALPVVPTIAVAATLGLRGLVGKIAPRSTVAAVAACAIALGLLALRARAVDRAALVVGADSGIDSPGFLRYYTADRAAIGKWFGRYARPDDYAAVGGAGAQVYYSGIRSLDCFGLSDEYIAHKVPAHDNRPGHEKYAPDDYILSRRPTIITSHNYRISDRPEHPPDEPFWRHHGYHYVSVEVPGLSQRWYTFLKRMDRSLGPLPAVNGEID